jgi:hypothetical protein
MARYKCPKCGRTINRPDRGKRPRSYCEQTGRNVRLRRLSRTVAEVVAQYRRELEG